MPLPSIIGAIEFRRDQYGWTQAEMAKALNFQPSHYSEFLSGKRKLPYQSLRRAYQLGIAADVLLQATWKRKYSDRKES